MRDPWIDLIASRIGSPVFTTSDEVRFNCPFKELHHTPDSHYHMYVNPIRGKFFCQSCRKGGSLTYLAQVLGLPNPDRTLTSWQRMLSGFLFGTEDEEEKVEAALPLDYTPMMKGTQAYAYIAGRGISDKKIEYYRIGFGTQSYDGMTDATRHLYCGKDRVILPDYDASERIAYWVARTYANHKAKYKNAKVPRETQVYNLGNLERLGRKDQVVICEGPISAIAAGYDAVCTYGKHVTGGQISRLVNFCAGEYVVAIDGDALGEAVSLATRLFRRGCKVRLVSFKYDEDPASIGQIEIRRRIRCAVPWTPNSLMEVL